MKNVLLTGANGLLGQKLVYALKSRNDIELLATGIGQNRLIDQANYSFQSLDITNKTEVDQTVKQFSPHVIINCAAMTNVDACELSQNSVGILMLMALNTLQMQELN
ncbi:MAG: hypothetical protein CM15mP65_23950 [Crocinitomicaceae bacterium]|nr:MAG: hypothetical protein CM15mP65_23950 [Crocinitomicaceae bacterium]